MAVGEMLVALRREPEEAHGAEAAAYLMDRPQGGWDSLVTKDELRTQVAELRVELHKELRAQTWQLAKLVAGAQGIVVIAIAAIGVMLRFA
jgi:hypothetical protein